MAVVFCIVLAAGCSSPKKDVLGKWKEHGKSETLEFFQDGKIAIAGSVSVTGTWLVLDDGRLKVEVGMLGMTQTLTGTVGRDELTLIGPRADTSRYDKIP